MENLARELQNAYSNRTVPDVSVGKPSQKIDIVVKFTRSGREMPPCRHGQIGTSDSPDKPFLRLNCSSSDSESKGKKGVLFGSTDYSRIRATVLSGYAITFKEHAIQI